MLENLLWGALAAVVGGVAGYYGGRKEREWQIRLAALDALQAWSVVEGSFMLAERMLAADAIGLDVVRARMDLDESLRLIVRETELPRGRRQDGASC